MAEVKFIANPNGGGHFEVGYFLFDDLAEAMEYALELESGL